MDEFNLEKFGEPNIWPALRENFKRRDQFVKACFHKIDALRILQYLKWRNQQLKQVDEDNLHEFMERYYPQKWRSLNIDPTYFSLETSKITLLDKVRNLLLEIEQNYQIENAG